MAIVSARSSISVLARAAHVHKQPSIGASSSVALGLPRLANSGRVRTVRCSAESKIGLAVSAAVAAAATSPAAMALVDDRMSTEGTGLPFGLSNNLLGWILFGVFGLIWSVYFIYTSGLEEDEDSGLSL